MAYDSASQAISPTMATSHHRVLLLLDVQEGMFSGKKAVPAATQVRNNITAILNHARFKANSTPLIIHVRNDGGSGEPDELGTPGWHLIHKPLSGEPVVDKSKNNAFAGTRLGKLIPEGAVIVVVGLQSDFCVRATCSAALDRGNNVLLIRGSHTTFDRLEVLHGRCHYRIYNLSHPLTKKKTCCRSGGGITPAGKIEREIEAELEEAGVVVMDMKDLPVIFADDR